MCISGLFGAKKSKLPDPKPSPIPLSSEETLDTSGEEIANRRRKARGFAASLLSGSPSSEPKLGRVEPARAA
jgi:hypothetical protein